MGSGAFLVEACRQLGDELVKAWHIHNCVPKIPPDEDELLHARRVIVQRCLYGVDKNPMAVDLAKLSLWLATLAKDHPFTFLDHALRAGDSLVGLTRQQIADFHWQRTTERRLGQEHIAERIERATKARNEILDAGDTLRPEDKAQRLAVADEALDAVRFFGDLCVAAFFAGDKEKARKRIRDDYLDALAEYLQSGDPRKRPTREVRALRGGERPVEPFHWEIEFPEVFTVDANGRPAGGFDGIVGNPPFMAKNTMSVSLHRQYGPFLLEAYCLSNGKSDIVAFFFRRSFDLLRDHGCFGLIATKTIAQGDTRSTGLTFLCTHGATVYCAEQRFPWPGIAAVSVSVVHILKGTPSGVRLLNGKCVGRITAFLFPRGPDTDPAPQNVNLRIGFQGANISGQGFLFDDNDERATPVSVMRTLIAQEPWYQERIFPFLGGEEINSRADLATDRYVIGFGRMELADAESRWPRLVAILRDKVRPDRESRPHNDQSRALAARWWQWHTDRPTLQAASDGMRRVLVASSVTAHFCFVFQSASRIFAHTLNVFALDTYSAFASVQCRVHEMWTRFFASSLEDRLRYTITDSFETFPFSVNWRACPILEGKGAEYYEHRALLMQKQCLALTDIYNRFHDPNEASPDIVRLRELHAAMDRAVLDTYGWTDIPTDCQFLLDYEDDEDEDGNGDSGLGTGDSGSGPHSLFPNPHSRRRSRKKPWRYRWPDEIRDEVLARLLDLNAKRAEQERLSGAAAASPGEKKKAKTRTQRRERAPDDAAMLLEFRDASNDD